MPGLECLPREKMLLYNVLGWCYGAKLPYLFHGKCGSFAKTVRLSGPECARYGPTGWSQGKSEDGKAYLDCKGVRAMEARNATTGFCFSPADKSYKEMIGKCVTKPFSSLGARKRYFNPVVSPCLIGALRRACSRRYKS